MKLVILVLVQEVLVRTARRGRGRRCRPFRVHRLVPGGLAPILAPQRVNGRDFLVQLLESRIDRVRDHVLVLTRAADPVHHRVAFRRQTRDVDDAVCPDLQVAAKRRRCEPHAVAQQGDFLDSEKVLVRALRPGRFQLCGNPVEYPRAARGSAENRIHPLLTGRIDSPDANLERIPVRVQDLAGNP